MYHLKFLCVILKKCNKMVLINKPQIKVLNFIFCLYKSKLFRFNFQCIMEKCAVVTGANNGCGLKICEELIKNGLKVVGIDLKDDNLKEKEIQSLICDITCEVSVKSAFKWIEENFKFINVLINCAGISNGFGILDLDHSMDELKMCMDVNCCGAIRCARYAYKIMMECNVQGLIINVNSVTGHQVIDMGKCKLGLYASSKHALAAATESMRLELNNMKNKNIRVTSISPGLINTTLFKTSNLSDEILKQMESKIEKLAPQDIADTVIYILSQPNRINISELIIRATGSTF